MTAFCPARICWSRVGRLPLSQQLEIIDQETLETGTLHQERYPRGPTPGTLHQGPYIRDPTPGALHQGPYTRGPTEGTLQKGSPPPPLFVYSGTFRQGMPTQKYREVYRKPCASGTRTRTHTHTHAHTHAQTHTHTYPQIDRKIYITDRHITGTCRGKMTTDRQTDRQSVQGDSHTY